MVWGTPGHVKAIWIVTLHFCKAHNSNPATLELAGVTKSGTPTNASHPRGLGNNVMPLNKPRHIILQV